MGKVVYLPPALADCFTSALERLECRICAASVVDLPGVLSQAGKWRPEANKAAVRFWKLIDENLEDIAQTGAVEAEKIITDAALKAGLFFDLASWLQSLEPGKTAVNQAKKWIYNARALRAARLGMRVLESDPELLQEVYKNDRH